MRQMHMRQMHMHMQQMQMHMQQMQMQMHMHMRQMHMRQMHMHMQQMHMHMRRSWIGQRCRSSDPSQQSQTESSTWPASSHSPVSTGRSRDTHQKRPPLPAHASVPGSSDPSSQSHMPSLIAEVASGGGGGAGAAARRELGTPPPRSPSRPPLTSPLSTPRVTAASLLPPSRRWHRWPSRLTRSSNHGWAPRKEGGQRVGAQSTGGRDQPTGCSGRAGGVALVPVDT